MVYAVGILVTVFLSNDATAVVLTPAVYAAVKKARTPALPYLLSCAFIANAASFVLPISNPANLVVYGKQLPPLIPWLKVFLLPSLISIAVTFLMLRLISNDALKGKMEDDVEIPELSTEGLRAAWGIGMAGAVLISASALGLDLGLPTFVAAVAAVLLATRANAKAISAVAGAVSWSVLPLVAGLFVLVEALDLHVVHRLGIVHCVLPSRLAVQIQIVSRASTGVRHVRIPRSRRGEWQTAFLATTSRAKLRPQHMFSHLFSYLALSWQRWRQLSTTRR